MPLNKYEKDKEITDLVRQRSRQGFEKLYAQYAGALYGIIRQMIHDEATAGKLLEETISYAWINIAQYNDKDNFFIWLLFICRRLCKQHLRDEPPVAKTQSQERMNGNFRSIMEMIVLKGKSYDEVARMMDVPASTVLSETRTELQSLREGRK